MTTFQHPTFRSILAWLGILLLPCLHLFGCINQQNGKLPLPPMLPRAKKKPKQPTKQPKPQPKRHTKPSQKQCYFIIVVKGMT